MAMISIYDIRQGNEPLREIRVHFPPNLGVADQNQIVTDIAQNAIAPLDEEVKKVELKARHIDAPAAPQMKKVAFDAARWAVILAALAGIICISAFAPHLAALIVLLFFAVVVSAAPDFIASQKIAPQEIQPKEMSIEQPVASEEIASKEIQPKEMSIEQPVASQKIAPKTPRKYDDIDWTKGQKPLKTSRLLENALQTYQNKILNCAHLSHSVLVQSHHDPA